MLCDHIAKNISTNDIVASHRLTISNESRNAKKKLFETPDKIESNEKNQK